MTQYISLKGDILRMEELDLAVQKYAETYTFHLKTAYNILFKLCPRHLHSNNSESLMSHSFVQLFINNYLSIDFVSET